MGWSWAPFIAQSVANYIAKAGSADAWVDNFISGGSSREEAESRRAALVKAASNYNVEMKPTFEEATIDSKIDALGISFDLENSQYRMDPLWIETKIPTELPKEFTCRSFFQLFGRLPRQRLAPMGACREFSSSSNCCIASPTFKRRRKVGSAFRSSRIRRGKSRAMDG